MFTHPALLRKINMTAEFLRNCGEGEWARRLTAAAERVRKSGWTDEAGKLFQALFSGEPSLHQLTLGAERRTRLDSMGLDTEAANLRLSKLREQLAELAQTPTVPERNPEVKPKRSPDLP